MVGTVAVLVSGTRTIEPGRAFEALPVPVLILALDVADDSDEHDEFDDVDDDALVAVDGVVDDEVVAD